jgi:ribonuclease HI
MKITAPHYLLLTEANVRATEPNEGSRWRFVLEQMDGEDRVEVSEREPDVRGERLELLAIVRGLEALEQPSKVTLITASKYVGRRIRHGFSQWKENDWRWESFGVLTPVKHADLWKRIEQAMQFHAIECRIWQWGASYPSQLGNESAEAKEGGSKNDRLTELSDSASLAEGECEVDPDSRIVFRRRRSGPRVVESGFGNDYSSVEEEFNDHETVAPYNFDSNQIERSLPSPSVFDDREFFQSKQHRSTRVVEIDPDRSQAVSFPQAFGCTIN